MDVEHSVDTLLDLRASDSNSSSSSTMIDSSWDGEDQSQLSPQLLTQIRSFSPDGELLVQFETAAAARKALHWASVSAYS